MSRTPTAHRLKLLPTPLLPLLLASALGGCGEGGPDAGPAIVTDTLPGGVVQVTSGAGGLWGEGDGWRLVDELRLGGVDAEGAEMFGTIPAIAADARGRILVLDHPAREVRVFGPEGDHLRTLGREGSGPGEFRNPVGLALHPDGSVWIVDPGNGRYTVFEEDGTFRTTHTRPMGYFAWPFPGGFDAEGRLWDLAAPDVLVGLSMEGQPADTARIPQYESERVRVTRDDGAGLMTMVAPFRPMLRWQIDARGHLWSAVSDRFRFVQERLGGDTVRIVTRTHTPVRVTPAEADSVREGMQSVIASFGESVRVEGDLGAPDHKPAFQAFLVDPEGHLWVEPSRAPGEPRTLEVFRPDGAYLGRVPIDPGLQLVGVRPFFRGDALYAVVNDELDVPQVVRYRIER
jgi:hypothetical protein